MINCWKFSIQLACYAYGVRHRSTLAPDKLGSLVPPPPKIPELAKPNPHARTAKPSKTLKRKHVMQQASLKRLWVRLCRKIETNTGFWCLPNSIIQQIREETGFF